MGKFRAFPLTPDRWPDLEKLFGPNGACAGCWCMWPRLKRADYVKGKGTGNRNRLKKIALSGEVAGLLLYDGKEGVGWCAVAPREKYPRIERSRNLKPVDDAEVWSIPCFFVAKSHRRQGVTAKLLEAAAAYAKKHGARIVEGYPVDPGRESVPDAAAWWGFAATFENAGFAEVARRAPARPIMRKKV